MALRAVDARGEDHTGAKISEISREVVGIHARYFGRGPTKAKAIWRSDVITVILEEIFTNAELVLVEGGKFELVRANRQAFQDLVEPFFRSAIEEITERRVRAFLSQVTREGIASEIFVLEPRDGAVA